jgi:hypothetical protein
MSGSLPVDPELDAINLIVNALSPLDDDSRTRVLEYVKSRLGVKTALLKTKEDDPAIGPMAAQSGSGSVVFSDLAELYEAARPNKDADKALVAAYWTQVFEGQESFDSQSINKGLKHLGVGVTNITGALSRLIEQKPSLILQLKKNGKSKQARKLFKVTEAGKKAVGAMISG